MCDADVICDTDVIRDADVICVGCRCDQSVWDDQSVCVMQM